MTEESFKRGCAVGVCVGALACAGVYLASTFYHAGHIKRTLEDDAQEGVVSSAPFSAEEVPEDCPGVGSEKAGKASSCEGCPNQSACASGKAAVDPAVEEMKKRLSRVSRKILVLSGKGGVGKSTVSANLALFLAQRDSESNVGLLDIDICGPSIPRMLGLANGGECQSESQSRPDSQSRSESQSRPDSQSRSDSHARSDSHELENGSRETGPSAASEVHQSALGWEPVHVPTQPNLGVMSIGFMLPNKDDAVIWRGARKHQMIKQFLCDVHWGDIDTLVVDTPPGTSDEHLSVVSLLKEAGSEPSPAEAGGSHVGTGGSHVGTGGSQYQTDIKDSLASTNALGSSRALPLGAVLVTAPNEVSLQDVRKEINFCKKVGVPILGVVENMSGHKCAGCGHVSQVFAPTSGGAQKMCEQLGLPFLGSVPLSEEIASRCDGGLVTRTGQFDAVFSRLLSSDTHLDAAEYHSPSVSICSSPVSKTRSSR